MCTISANMASTSSSTQEQELASKYISEDRFFDAKRELVKVDEKSLTPEEKQLIQRVEECESSINIVKNELDPSWKVVGEAKKGNFKISTVYKAEYKPVKVDFIVECPMEKSLVFPMLAVINEVDLYPTWLPKWSTPKFQVVRAESLQRSGRSAQVGTIRVEHPLATAEFYVDILLVDDTESRNELIVSIDPMEEGDADPRGLVPPVVEGVNRVTCGGGLLFRKCPADRAAEAKKLVKKKKPKKNDQDENENENEDEDEYVLFSLSVVYANKKKFIDPGIFIRKISGFLIKVVSGLIFSKLLTVAEEVRVGKRPDHDKAIAEKTDTYEFLKKCVDRLK